MRPSDVELSRLAVAWGWLDQADFRCCLQEADRCQAMGLDKGIDEIFLEERRLSREQLQRLRHHLGWSLERSRIGGFEILRRIGVGGSGSVFEARHVRLNQRVALKVLYPRYAKNKRMRRLFLRETRALARLNHPHLVHAFDGGRDGKYHYLAMEYVEGENLLQCLTRDGPLSVSRTLDIVKAVCGALTALEARRLVHRDIKPANILLTEDGGVKLADLGLLKIETGSAAAEWVCGTPHYLSPEQARGDGTEDIRSDIYSLGATWYHALAGRPPFVGGSSREIILAHEMREPSPLRKFRDDVPPAVERTVLGWLSKDPGLRPATSRQAIEELQRLERSNRAPAPAGGSSARWVLIAASLVVAGALVIWVSLRGDSPSGSSVSSSSVTVTTTPEPARVTDDGIVRPVSARPLRAEEADGSTSTEVTPSGGHVAEAPDAPVGSNAMRERSPAVADTTTSEVTRRLLESIGRELSQRARMFESGLGRVWSDGWRRLEHLSPGARDRFDALQPLRRAFHALRSTLVPVDETEVVVLLDYDFSSRGELDDFRARPGSLRVRDGDLIPADDPFGATIESVAWFKPPVRLEGEVSPGTRLTLGFGDLRISPWADRGRAIRRDRSSPRSRNAAAFRNAPLVFELRLDGAGLYLRTGDQILVDPRPVPVRGRVSVRIENGALRWLRIESRLEMGWAAERLRLLNDQ